MPDYSKANAQFSPRYGSCEQHAASLYKRAFLSQSNAGHIICHIAGRLQKIVFKNLVTKWETEVSRKTYIDDFDTVDAE